MNTTQPTSNGKNIRRSFWTLLLGASLGAMTSVSASPVLTIVGDPSDGSVHRTDPPEHALTNAPTIITGRNDAGFPPWDYRWHSAFLVFDLSTIELEAVSASLNVFYEGRGGSGQEWQSRNLDLWFVGYSDAADNYPDSLTHITSSTDPIPENIKLLENFIRGMGEQTETETWQSTGHLQGLADVINNRSAGENFAFFRLNANETPGEEAWHSFASAVSDNKPYLNVTVIPEPSTLMFGLAALAGLVWMKRRRK